MKKFGVWSRNKRALSPVFATVLLATIVIVFGSVTYYYTSNLTSTATSNYVDTLADSKQSMSERIGFEDVVYVNSGNPLTLKIYVINCGIANNVQIGSVFLYYTSSHNLVGSPIQGSVVNSEGSFIFPLFHIDDGASIQSNSLNVGNEGYFVVPLSGPLQSGTSYTIHLITQSGSAFDYEFKP